MDIDPHMLATQSFRIPGYATVTTSYLVLQLSLSNNTARDFGYKQVRCLRPFLVSVLILLHVGCTASAACEHGFTCCAVVFRFCRLLWSFRRAGGGVKDG